MSYLALAKKAEERLKHYVERSSLVKDHSVEATEVHEAETIQGVKIASTVLNDDIWLILDRSFIPHDGLAVYYAEEIPLLRDKTPEDLREIHKVKLAFPGCRVIQEGPERTPHCRPGAARRTRL